MTKFANKTILITGGASGIGEMMGDMVLRKEARQLIIWDVDAEAMERVADAFKKLGKVTCFQVDLSDLDQIKSACENLEKEGIHVDILINNAGIVVGQNFWEHTHEDIERTLSVNTRALMHVALCLLPNMMKRGEGHIVNIASAAGMVGIPKMSVYAASKWAVIGWSESLRLELKHKYPDIVVTTVTPSYIDTGMFEGVKTHPIQPILTTQKAAEKILNGVKRNKIFVRMPWSVYFLPMLKGLLPVRWFDWVVGKVLKVYDSMSGFKGR